MMPPPRSTTFVLLPGAGGAAWYWNLVVPLLESAGHEAVAVDLPGPDADAGLAQYAAVAAAAIGTGDRDGADVVLVAQSLGGFTAAMTCAQVPVRSLILVNAMIPVPGETPGAWWAATGAVEVRDLAAAGGGYGEFDLDVYFLHDVPPEVVADGEAHQRPEADAVFSSACEFDAWPDIPTRVIAGAEDRFFPPSSSAGSHGTVSASSPRSCPAAISSHCRNPKRSPSSSCATPERSRSPARGLGTV